MRSSVMLLGMATALMVGTACSSTGGEGNTVRRRGQITAEELQGVTATDCLEAVRQLRPQWLRSRAAATPRDPNPSPQVIVDGTPRGGLENLSQLNPRNVETMDYLSAGDATIRYGTGYTSGAIVVVTRRR